MIILQSKCSITRFSIKEPIPKDLWPQIPEKLKQFAFQDIDATTQERSWGWTNIDDMLDTDWALTHPVKGAYITFSLRLETRRIAPAIFKKHKAIAVKKELDMHPGKHGLSKNRKAELFDAVRNKLLKHTLPTPALFDVIWDTNNNLVYLTSLHSKLIDLFINFFETTFELKLAQETPHNLAGKILDASLYTQIESVPPTRFI